MYTFVSKGLLLITSLILVGCGTHDDGQDVTTFATAQTTGPACTAAQIQKLEALDSTIAEFKSQDSAKIPGQAKRYKSFRDELKSFRNEYGNLKCYFDKNGAMYQVDIGQTFEEITEKEQILARQYLTCPAGLPQRLEQIEVDRARLRAEMQGNGRFEAATEFYDLLKRTRGEYPDVQQCVVTGGEYGPVVYDMDAIDKQIKIMEQPLSESARPAKPWDAGPI